MLVDKLLGDIDTGFIALPVFQRGYVWNREQVRGFFRALYRGNPVGSLLFWDTKVGAAKTRGDLSSQSGLVRMLLDGQQRATSLYGVIRGKPPRFFEGNSSAFTGLHFHLEDEVFEFHQPVKMKSDPLWVDVTLVMQTDLDKLGSFIPPSIGDIESYGRYMARLGKLRNIGNRDLKEDEIAGAEKSLDEVVDIFNEVNSGGTKLSIGDLTLARICGVWPEARDLMNDHLKWWSEKGYGDFDLVWLLRSVNTILTEEAQFSHLHDEEPLELERGLTRAVDALDYALNLVGARLGLDHGRVLFGRQAFPVMAFYIDRKEKKLSSTEQGQLLYWYLFGSMRGRFSGSIETVMNQQLTALKEGDGLGRLIDELHLWAGSDQIAPDHFNASQTNSRFYPVLYMLTRTGSARNFCDGIELKQALLGKGSSLEVHHIFPKSRLYKAGYDKRQVNALANFCFLTSECNKEVGAQRPEHYFPRYEAEYPGVLASQWIPSSDEPWTLDRYPEFLERRRELLAAATNQVLEQLRGGAESFTDLVPAGGVSVDDEEERELLALQTWAEERGLAEGVLGHELSALQRDVPPTVLDLAWPDGVQAELTQAVAVLLNEPRDVVADASAAGFRCFTSVEKFQEYVESEILGEVVADD